MTEQELLLRPIAKLLSIGLKPLSGLNHISLTSIYESIRAVQKTLGDALYPHALYGAPPKKQGYVIKLTSFGLKMARLDLLNMTVISL